MNEKTWEEEWKKLVEGRVNSKYHKNYIALHIAEDFIRNAITQEKQTLKQELLEMADKILSAYGVTPPRVDSPMLNRTHFRLLLEDLVERPTSETITFTLEK